MFGPYVLFSVQQAQWTTFLQHEGYLGTDHVIVNHSQMAPESATPPPNSQAFDISFTLEVRFNVYQPTQRKFDGIGFGNRTGTKSKPYHLVTATQT
ncbi:hypothetical protein AVEN_7832-1 [Araneus ventricosus]|uniref:Uncharacterized protein n=1 Tax=Araneus ventricosus TaxID=182803 RepID=A0A4Y2F2N0_ARAVE|nr:hypothetical protein AVEN_7832-1 [Araneus ventricosus]